MTANELRQSFLDFFREKQHTIVPSASLMPTSPNLQFTNAGMNQFVPYFLGTEKAPYDPPRAADTQKCIRAGGKHNDLEDVGYDTYHHTFFEMLGNWSFGDYFKEEAIAWAWELFVERWGFPPERLYATVYAPEKGDPAEFDQEAYDHWAVLFEKAGLDPKAHIIDGNAKDNFWAMGDTGPCGPCSELHVDLTEKGDTGGKLVNMDDARCIEIWNLVFIQFNHDEDGSYRSLPAQHVDTGMGFERAASVMQCTKGLTDFSKLCSNYDTDVFAPLFAKLAEITGRTYTGTVPKSREGLSEQEQTDVAFRVIADHIRTVSFSIADGILPGNKGRNSTIRAILRRAVRFGRELGLEGDRPFLHELVPVLVTEMGDAFPELAERKDKVTEIITSEEAQFNKTLDRGLRLFDDAVAKLDSGQEFPPPSIVKLWETFGFPLELTDVLLQEKGLTTDEAEVAKLIEQHKKTGEEGQETSVVSAVDIETDAKSEFVGFDTDEIEVELLEIIDDGENFVVIVDKSPLYVEKGGQVGDTGTLTVNGEEFPILATSSVGEALCLHLADAPKSTGKATVQLDQSRRRNIEKHHTATHIMHWALHEVVDPDARQQGSFVGPDRLRFDFNSKALTSDQVRAIEEKVNAKIAEQDYVSWTEVPHEEVKDRSEIMQAFGEKYGDVVRVVQIGGKEQKLDGYSMELCGGTHVRNTGDIGFFKIGSEGAVAAGIRRIEAQCGAAGRELVTQTYEALKVEIDDLESRLQTTNEALAKIGQVPEIAPERTLGEIPGDAAIDAVNAALVARQKERDQFQAAVQNAGKRFKKASAGAAAAQADELLGELVEKANAEGAAIPQIVHHLGETDASLLQEALNGLKKRQFEGVAVFTLVDGGKAHIGIAVAKGVTDKFKAGELMRDLAPIVGGKGGGKPEMARGAGADPSKVEELLEAARGLLGQ
tara:strand:+ start:8581 stop:11400 length:2820 start_codon:yes stop_codon:yes gene_type:complete